MQNKSPRRVAFFERTQLKRPVAFLMKSDKALLRNGLATSGQFETIGTKEQTSPLIMQDYLSYEEMQISAFLSIASPTFFINKGDRNNKGVHGEKGTFEETGYLVGMVGGRFEKQGVMEYQHILVTPEQNTEENGYGHKGNPEKKIWLDLWAKHLYKIEVFYSYKGVEEFYGSEDGKNTYFRKDIPMSKPHYFNIKVYKKRMNFVIEPFLAYCNTVAEKEKKNAYVHNVGLGLGVWQCTSQQNEWLLDVYWEILKRIPLKNISDLDFSYFKADKCGQVGNGEKINEGPNTHITIHFSQRDPAEKLVGPNAGKLLIANYAWDSNAFPGNEYYFGQLTASGDPSAACCSLISELQNPYINPNLYPLTSSSIYNYK